MASWKTWPGLCTGLDWTGLFLQKGDFFFPVHSPESSPAFPTGPQTIPFGARAAHTYMAYMRGTPPPGGVQLVPAI